MIRYAQLLGPVTVRQWIFGQRTLGLQVLSSSRPLAMVGLLAFWGLCAPLNRLSTSVAQEATTPESQSNPATSAESPDVGKGPTPPSSSAPESTGQPGSTPADAATSGAAAGTADGSSKPADGTATTAPPPVLRSTKPDETVRPARFDYQSVEDGQVKFQFQGAPWPLLIDWLSDISGRAIDWQELPGDHVNLHTQKAYSVREVQDLLNRHLLARGYTLLQDGEFLHVVKTAGINSAIVPRVSLEELRKCFPHDFVKISFELDWLMASKLTEELKTMISPNGKLTPLTTTNRIEAMDAALNLQQIARLISEEQSSSSQDELLREFVLENVRAAHVKEKLDQLLGQEQPQAAPVSPEMQQQQMMMQMQMRQMEMQQRANGQPVPEQPKVDVQVIVNQQRNSVIVQAPPDRMAVIAEAVRLLDVPDRRGGSLESFVSRIQTYRLSTLNPQEVVEILLDTGSLEPDTRIKVDTKNKAIIVNGPPWDHLTVEKMIKKLDGSPRDFKVIRLRRRRAEQVAVTVQKLMVGDGQQDKESQSRRSSYYYEMWNSSPQEEEKSSDGFRVAADVEHNWLLLWCNQAEHERVLGLVAELGEVIGRGGAASEVRVIDELSPEEADELLRRVRDAFRPLAPNHVELPPPQSPSPTTPSPTTPSPTTPSPTTQSPTTQSPTTQSPTTQSPTTQSTTTSSPTTSSTPSTESAEQPTTGSAEPPTSDASPDAAAPAAPAQVPAADPLHEKFGQTDWSKHGLAWSEAADTELRQQLARAQSEETSGPAAAADSAQMTGNSAPPITVTRRPEGGLEIRSQDTAALDVFEELMNELRPPRRPYQVFKLKSASATFVKWQLEDYFEEKKKDDDDRLPYYYYDYFDAPPQTQEEKQGLSEQRPIRFISDIDTNTIVVRDATADQLRIVKELIELYDVPEPTKKDQARQTLLVRVRYSRASMIADQIKDAFRDLLSGNDKAFEQQPQQGQQAQPGGGGGQERERPSGGSSYATGLDFGEGETRQRSETRATFKGKLSLGVDDTTNTILVSTEGETLMKIIVAMIKELDDSAKPIDEVRVVRLRSGAAYEDLQEALKRTFGDNVQITTSSRKAGEQSAAGDGAAQGGRKPRTGGSPVESAPAPQADGRLGEGESAE